MESPVRRPGDGGHDMLLHLCLAVLAAAVGVTIAWLLLRRGPAGRPDRLSQPASAGIGRGPPPRTTPERLSALCVLRL
jgi:hypothetical protein